MSEKEKSIKILEDLFIEERSSILPIVRERNWMEFSAPIEYLETLCPCTDDENTLWEQGYLKGIEACINALNNPR